MWSFWLSAVVGGKREVAGLVLLSVVSGQKTKQNITITKRGRQGKTKLHNQTTQSQHYPPTLRKKENYKIQKGYSYKQNTPPAARTQHKKKNGEDIHKAKGKRNENNIKQPQNQDPDHSYTDTDNPLPQPEQTTTAKVITSHCPTRPRPISPRGPKRTCAQCCADWWCVDLRRTHYSRGE